jgi:hypothetical protein
MSLTVAALTRVLFGSQIADYAPGEIGLAKTVLPSLCESMWCLAHRGFSGSRCGSRGGERFGPAVSG